MPIAVATSAQVNRVDERRAVRGQSPSALSDTFRTKMRADKLQHGIAQKLEPLVVARRLSPMLV